MAKNLNLKDCVELRQFACLNDYVDYCDSVDKACWGGSQSSNTGSVSFTGTKSYKHASELIRAGWPEGVRRVHKAMTVIAQAKDSVEMLDSRFDIVGCAPIVPAYLTGDPECMFNPMDTEERPIVNIVMDISASCGVDQEHIVNRGAAVLMFAAALEENGQRVAIHTSNVAKSQKSGKWHASIVQVKAAHLDFNIHALSYALVNASMLRRHSFRITEGLPADKGGKEFESGYGMPANLIDVKGIAGNVGDIDLYVKGIGYNSAFETIQGAVDEIDKIAKEQGLIA